MSRRGKRELELTMSEADDYAEWSRAARAYDKLTGKDQWRLEEPCRFYDNASIRRRLNRLKSLRRKKDNHGLLFTLNEGIHGNLDGIGSPKLYRQARFGTKKLITDYIDEVVSALEYLAALKGRGIPFEEKLEFFRRADHCYGRSALMLSGGAALGHFHVGVAKALLEEDVLPSVISGSSAGSVVAGILGTHSDDELHEFFKTASLASEAKSEAGWFSRTFSIANPRIDADGVAEIIERLIPDLTFEEAFERTGRKINVSIAPAEKHQSSRLLNAVTAPNVYIRKAVLASCAVPGIYPPVKLEAKNVSGERQPYLPSRRWVDGSVSHDMPMKRLSRLYGVNHYIASQTNPIVLWFIQDPKARQGLLSTALQASYRSYQEWLRATQPLTQKLARRIPRVELLYNTFYSVATQTYTGDINIIPRSRVFNPTRLLTNLTEKEIMYLVKEGERATWPRIENIRNCSRISHTLERILEDYERRAVRYAHRKSKAENVA